MATTSAHELRGGKGASPNTEALIFGTALHVSMNPDHRGGPNFTLTSNEWVSKNGRKPKSTSPSIKVTAPRLEMVLRILDFDPQKAADLQVKQYLVIMVGSHVPIRLELTPWPQLFHPCCGVG